MTISDRCPDRHTSIVSMIRRGSTWFEEKKRLPSDGAAGSNFGFSISLVEKVAFPYQPSIQSNGRETLVTAIGAGPHHLTRSAQWTCGFRTNSSDSKASPPEAKRTTTIDENSLPCSQLASSLGCEGNMK